MKMTARERLMTVLKGGIPDHVPVAPDTSNMIPARLTGLPFWDLYLYRKIPIWKAYIACVKHFGFDSLMDGYADIRFESLGEIDHDRTEMIVFQNDSRIVTQTCRQANGRTFWDDRVRVYYRDNPPTGNIRPESIGLPAVPAHAEPIEGRTEWPAGEALLRLVKEEMGDRGLVGVSCGTSLLIHNQEEIYEYADNPDLYHEKRDQLLEAVEKRFYKLMSLDAKPDFICTGGSGSLVFQSPQTFRELALPVVKKVTALCRAHGIPSHLHSCGPETQLVRMAAEETDLTVIDPLEIPPMGDCDLRALKLAYGDRLVLKGNLHTTGVMLNGTPDDVARAARQAIDDAADGGRFILSTGDQCGRDTPDENLLAMIETARSYGRY
jgi:uroporphyrinogen decarboxylase